MTDATRRRADLRQMLSERRRAMQDDVQRRIRDGRTDRSTQVCDDLERSEADSQGKRSSSRSSRCGRKHWPASRRRSSGSTRARTGRVPSAAVSPGDDCERCHSPYGTRRAKRGGNRNNDWRSGTRGRAAAAAFFPTSRALEGDATPPATTLDMSFCLDFIDEAVPPNALRANQDITPLATTSHRPAPRTP